jgi:hypothetical protein
MLPPYCKTAKEIEEGYTLRDLQLLSIAAEYRK